MLSFDVLYKKNTVLEVINNVQSLFFVAFCLFLACMLNKSIQLKNWPADWFVQAGRGLLSKTEHVRRQFQIEWRSNLSLWNYTL